MNISKQMEKTLIDEIRLVHGNMAKTNVPAEKMYNFSAVYGMANRIINFEYDPELLFLNQVIQLAYNMINARLSALATRQDVGIDIPESMFTKIEGLLEKLADAIEQKQEICTILQNIIALAYTTTGNGYYMYKKGLIKI